MSSQRVVAIPHPRNIHQNPYNFDDLCSTHPELKAFVKTDPHGDKIIDFSDPQAMLCLNQALLKQHYQIQHWSIPEGHLCPAIADRAEYIHYAADLLGSASPGQDKVKVLDISTGADLINPIIGSQVYGWQFLAYDSDPVSVESAKTIVNSNSNLSDRVEVVLQKNRQHFFKNIIKETDRFALSLCNSPFQASEQEAQAGTIPDGQSNELSRDGDRSLFLKDMVEESIEFAQQVHWFTSPLFEPEGIIQLRQIIMDAGVAQMKVKIMKQSEEISYMLAWSFVSADEEVVVDEMVPKHAISL